jgi:hypothetical protein
MAISRVTATTFHKFLGNGRTSPAIFTCEGPDLSAPEEFVVKLKGGLERREKGLLYELYASALAQYFGMLVPRPALVLIEEDLAGVVQERLADDRRGAQIIRDSVGLNFGSQFLVNLTVWPIDKYVPTNMREAAMKVFAYDALIQNPDRSFNNPNLGSRGDDLFVFDHEMAFSFLLSILPNPTPWNLAGEEYLSRHVFAKVLRNVPFPADFQEALIGLSDELLSRLGQQVPEEWRSEDLARIEAHLSIMREHASDFSEEVLRRLA